MGMEDPLPTFTYLVEQMKEKYPNLAYLHSVDAKAFGNEVPKDPSVSGHRMLCVVRPQRRR